MSKSRFDQAASRALSEAAFVCDLIKARELLQAGADPNVRDEDGRTPLVSAVLGGSVGLVGLLLENERKHGDYPSGGFTALHFAAEEQLPEMTRLLLAKGANPNARDGDGVTPLGRAVFSEREQRDVIQTLVKAGANPDLANNAGETPRALATRLGSTAFTAN